MMMLKPRSPLIATDAIMLRGMTMAASSVSSAMWAASKESFVDIPVLAVTHGVRELAFPEKCGECEGKGGVHRSPVPGGLIEL